jgi:HEAT repeat protein
MIRRVVATFFMTALFSGVPALAQPAGQPTTDTADRVISALIGALKDPDREVRRQAAQSLSGFESTRIVEPMTTLLKDEDVQLRKHAANALARLGDERAVPALIAALKDADPEMRMYAARALGQIGDARAVDPLTGSLKDEDANVRRTAIRALGSIADGRGPRKPSTMITPKVRPGKDMKMVGDKMFEKMLYIDDIERKAIKNGLPKNREL